MYLKAIMMTDISNLLRRHFDCMIEIIQNRWFDYFFTVNVLHSSYYTMQMHAIVCKINP